MASYFIPSDWEMSPKLLEWTKAKGLTDKTIENELESFRDHQYKRPMQRPDACWRNWVKNGIKWGSIVPTTLHEYRTVVPLTDSEKSADILAFERQMTKFGR